MKNTLNFITVLKNTRDGTDDEITIINQFNNQLNHIKLHADLQTIAVFLRRHLSNIYRPESSRLKSCSTFILLEYHISL